MKQKELYSSIVKGTYFSNWADLFGYPLAYSLVPLIAKVPFLTPNVVTVFSFLLFTFGSFSLFLTYPYHLFVAALCITAGYIGDDIDGQLARYRKLSSHIGDFLDKVLDVLKIYIITLSVATAVYFATSNVLYVYLGFTACFFFNFRYYIKFETMFVRINADPDYLAKSAQKRKELESEIERMYDNPQKTLWEVLQVFWHKNRTIFFVDEAELAIFTSVGALFDKLEWALVIIALSQVVIAILRFFERLHQIRTNSLDLLKPMRK